MSKIQIYTTSTCPYCHAAKALLDKKNAQYEEILVHDASLRAKMVERAGRRSVPQIFIGDNHIGGFDDMALLDREGKLDALLNA